MSAVASPCTNVVQEPLYVKGGCVHTMFILRATVAQTVRQVHCPVEYSIYGIIKEIIINTSYCTDLGPYVKPK